MVKNRYNVVAGTYFGATDDVAGRYYIFDQESDVVNKRGPGHTWEKALRIAAELNVGEALGEALSNNCCG